MTANKKQVVANRMGDQNRDQAKFNSLLFSLQEIADCVLTGSCSKTFICGNQPHVITPLGQSLEKG